MSSPPSKRPKLEESSGATVVKIEKRKQIKIKKEQEPPLPRPFELPRNYPKAVANDLEKGLLTGKTRIKFLSSIAAAMFRYRSYPTRDEFDHVAEEIVKAFPFMRSGDDTGHVSFNLCMSDCIHKSC